MIFGVFAAEIMTYLNTTAVSNIGLVMMVGYSLVASLVIGFIGFYLISEIIPDST
jgi:hypothetical protein